MEYAYILIIGCSLTVLLMIAVNTCSRLGVVGSRTFLAQLAFIAVWSVGALLELIVRGSQAMLFWYNVGQVGMFGVSVSCICFAAEYAGFTRLKAYLPLLMAPALAAVVLIFMDPTYHVMRSGYVINYSSLFGQGVHAYITQVGMVFTTYAFCLMIGAVVILTMFAVKVARALRRQVFSIILSILLVLLSSVIKVVVLEKRGINIPVAAIFLPANLLLFYSLFRHSLFTVSPIGRDKAFDVIEQGIVVVDGVGMIVDRNPFTVQLFKTWFGVTAEMTGQSMNAVFSAFPLWVELTKACKAGQFEVQSSREGVGDCYFRFKVYPLQSDRRGTVTIIRDITERRLQEQELKTKADTDGLTGLLNRTGFLDVFSRQLAEAERAGEPISTLILDLDRFKTVNDTYGHINADRVLVLFSELLRGTLRQQDAIGRIGGDEFAASLPGVPRTEAFHIAERIRQKAAEEGVEMDGGDVVHFTVSIGIADSADRLNKGDPPQADDLIKLADKAMYRAKRVSRNCCVVGE